MLANSNSFWASLVGPTTKSRLNWSLQERSSLQRPESIENAEGLSHEVGRMILRDSSNHLSRELTTDN